MMKKVLYGVALALLASVSVGTLQSCKDDVSDLKTQTAFDLDALQNALNNESARLQAQITANKLTIDKIWETFGDYARVQYVNDQLAALKANLNKSIEALQNNITASNATLTSHINALDVKYNGKIVGLQAQDVVLLNMINGALGEISGLKSSQSDLESKLNSIKSSLGEYAKQSDLAKYMKTDNMATWLATNGYLTEQKLLEYGYLTSADLEGYLKDDNGYLKAEALEPYLKKVDADELYATINDLQTLEGRVTANENAIDAMLQAINSMNDNIATNGANIDILKKKLLDYKNELIALDSKMNVMKAALEDQIDQVRNDLNDLTTRVSTLEKNMKDVLNFNSNLVTGILIQGVNSPVFGDFSLPIGVKSNILFNWYGYNKFGEDFQFPTSAKEYSANHADAGVNFAGAPFVTIPEGVYPTEVELGTVYVTLNPVGSNLSNVPVTIQNSLGEPLLLKVKDLQVSNYLLKHGLSRAEDGNKIENKLYEGQVVLDPTNNKELSQVRIEVDKSLESTMKDALKDPSKRTAVALMKALYNQFNGMLPAYALCYGWNVETSDPEFSTKSYSVLSQYDLAVATAKPLSYNFLFNEGTDKQLPTIGNIENIIYNLKDKVNIQISKITLDKFDIDFTQGLQVSVDDVDLFIVIPDLRVLDDKNVPYNKTIVLSTKDLRNNTPALKEALKAHGYTYNENTEYDVQMIDGMKSLESALQNSIVNALDQVGTKVSDQMKNQIEKQINDKVIGALQKDINTQIGDIIEDLGDEMQPYFNKVNRAFDIYNKIANKINKFLKNPNAYLQATALYSMNGDYGFVSGKKNDPSIYKGNGSFNIYLTSYTGDIIVPAYKKYVAVTGYVDDNGKVQPIAVNDAINSGELNTVLPGDRIRVSVPVAGFKSKTIYELTYQAIDYSGYTSTKKMYVQVIK